MQGRGDVFFKDARGFQTQNRADAFATGKYTVTHGGVNRRGRSLFRGQELFQRGVHSDAVFFEEIWEFHQGRELACATAANRAANGLQDSDSGSGSNGWATIFPSAFFSRISTRPSASSSCFWHSRESATPSSKSFMASSSESWGLSRRRTTSSRRASERSKSGFLGGSGFLGAGEFTRSAFFLGSYFWQCAQK